MSYEMRFYVVQKSFNATVDGTIKRYGSIIAMFDYCADDKLADYTSLVGKETDTFLSIRDDTITKDMYGKPLRELTIDQMLEFFKTDDDGKDYRRQKPFIKLLEGFKENIDQFEDLVVLRYGY